MRFTDRVDIVSANDPTSVVYANVPAIVGTAQTMEKDTAGAPYGSLVQLRALVGAEWETKLSISAHRVRWRGRVYDIPSAPVPRMRKHVVNHVVVPLEVQTGS